MKRKITLCILLILIIMCVTLLSYEKINKTEISNDNGMFAIFLEEEKDSGKYQKSNLKTWPTEEEYTINMLKSYCENGSILRWNSKTKKISLKVNGTDKCYVYFDKAEIGTEKHPHLIQTIEDLVRLSNDVADGKTYAGEYFLLTNDLDFNDPSDYENPESMEFGNINGINEAEPLIKELTTGSGFVSIGNSSTNPFQGIFDGGNKRIDNLYINNNLNNYVGLFGYIVNAKINNLSISGNIKSSISMEAGSFSGWGSDFTIINCQSYVNISGSTGKQSIGGFVGTAGGNNVIKSSQNYGNISNGNNTGGFVGNNTITLLIDNSQNYGKITNDLGYHAGGLIGRDDGNYSQTTITNSHNEGKIKNLNNVAGGLIGDTYGSVIINKSYNSNNAEIVGKYAGGLIGYSHYITDIQNSYNLANVNQSSYAGGIIGYLNTTQLNTLTNVYNAGEISGNFRVGGLIGLLEANTIIDKSYNLGNVIGYNSDNAYFMLGGLVSHIYGVSNSYKLIILNSYNLGNLEQEKNVTINADMGGLIYMKSLPCEVKIINSFNAGDVTSKNDNAFGIILMNSNTTLNNVYNIGKVNGVTSYGIGGVDNIENVIIKNTYYENSVSASSVDGVGTSMALEQMKKQEFVDELNQNIASINLSEIDEILKGYTLSKWKLGKNNYPELVNE